jgi:flagellar biosynthesis protein FlhB
MRKLFLILSVVFGVLGITFTILPLDTLGFLPIGLALVFGLLTLKQSEDSQKKFPKIILTIAALCSAVVLGKTLLVKDEVATDTQFEQQKIETKQEAKKELEELEGLE